MGAAEDLAYLQGVVAPVRITEGITNRQLAILMKEAAAEAADVINTLGKTNTWTNAVRAKQLEAVLGGIGPVSTEMWSRTGKLTEAGMFTQAALAADQALDRDFFLGMPGYAVSQYARAMHIDALTGVEAVLSRRTSGHTLAARIYAGGQATTSAVGRIVEKGLILQKSAREIAGEVRHFYRPDVPGGASYAAMRLARTEINNAHHATTIRMSAQRPWVQGMRWELSLSHPFTDPCDDYATADDYGLGQGVYPTDSVPDRPHPQCLCFLTHLQMDDDAFIDGLANGLYDDWLDERGVVC